MNTRRLKCVNLDLVNRTVTHRQQTNRLKWSRDQGIMSPRSYISTTAGDVSLLANQSRAGRDSSGKHPDICTGWRHGSTTSVTK